MILDANYRRSYDIDMKETEYISVNRAAEMLGVTDGRVRQLLSAGILAGEKLSERAWMIRRSAVREFAKRRRSPGNPNWVKKT